MASVFDALDAEIQAVVSDAFGERVRFEPRSSAGQYAAEEPDPARPVREVTAVVTSVVGSADLRGDVGGQARSTSRLAGQETTAWLGAEVVSALGYEITTGDRLVRLDEPGAPMFRVGQPKPTEAGDLVLTLAPLARAKP